MLLGGCGYPSEGIKLMRYIICFDSLLSETCCSIYIIKGHILSKCCLFKQMKIIYGVGILLHIGGLGTINNV